MNPGRVTDTCFCQRAPSLLKKPLREVQDQDIVAKRTILLHNGGGIDIKEITFFYKKANSKKMCVSGHT